MWPFTKKTVTIADSHLLEGFVDWHCHLLPGVDDGVKKLEETLAILDLMERNGFSRVYLTPHIMEEIPNTPDDLRERFSRLVDTYKGSLDLHLGAEHMMDNLYMQRMADNNLLPVEPDKQHLLVETSFINPPMGMDKIIDQTFSAGYFPLLAHPERYRYMVADDYKRLKQRGVLFQLNLPSLTGFYGPEAKEKAEMILDKGWYDRMGTDTHHMRAISAFIASPIARKHIPAIEALKTNR